MKETFKQMVEEFERDYKIYPIENNQWAVENNLWAVEVRGEIWSWCPTEDKAKDLAWTLYLSEQLS